MILKGPSAVPPELAGVPIGTHRKLKKNPWVGLAGTQRVLSGKRVCVCHGTVLALLWHGGDRRYS